MKVALVASSCLHRAGGLERHVDQLARGLARRGAQVEVLIQDRPRRLPHVFEFDGVVHRRFAASIGTAGFAIAPGLWKHLRRTAGSLDVAHVHSVHPSLALAVALAGPRHLVFTPHAPIQHLVRWPYARVSRAVVDHAAETVCTSTVEGDLLCGRFPWAASRIRVVPKGVDVATIQAARSFPGVGLVVLSVGRLERHERVDRVVGAMASVDPVFRLVVVGDGPLRRRLEAHAADLGISSRVQFVGSVPDPQLYRWLRTGRVLVTLAEQAASGLQVVEAISAGAPVVASDIPVHREAASRAGAQAVCFVSPEGSPLEVADAISDAARMSVPSSAPATVPSWDAVVDTTWAIYRRLVSESPRAGMTSRGGMAELQLAGRRDGPDVAVDG